MIKDIKVRTDSMGNLTITGPERIQIEMAILGQRPGLAYESAGPIVDQMLEMLDIRVVLDGGAA